ncbi:disease resistance protein RPV1-like isoform X2 [Apium graveolens]|uniref:disease resistance protein RPV1-like isoform X2 n=1 Tax=Apium graveolens TaxID=4045 RepID=UPI003D793C9E
MASSSSRVWDVFLSFYGKDTRNNFISHLYKELDGAGIVTFKDDPALEKGEEISPALRSAIRSSKKFVVVISENYAKSRWCLDELVEILSLKEKTNQVFPVFFYVDPTDLRNQQGSFCEPLKSNKKRYSVDTIEKWKSALAELADLAGFHLKKEADKSEAECIMEIVAKVMPPKVLDLDQYLPGINRAVEEIYQLLSIDYGDARALGICGMGGSGKTTIAKAFFNKYSHKFDISCFMENVKQTSQGRSPLLPLLQQLLMDLLRVKDYKARDVESALRKLKEILSYKKALVVLDDLDQLSYSEVLVRICKLFSCGSRVIITGRDANLLIQLKVQMSKVDIYYVKHLNRPDSLELFSFHAFRKPTPPRNYEVLSKEFVTYAGGLPLALKVLGSSLCGRTDVPFWEAKLEKIRKFPVEDIQRILQMSYDELPDEAVKAIFLDIVFFFVGENKDEAVDVFKSCDFFPEIGIPILVEKCLLSIDKYNNRFWMHNLIQDMGWNVIREESKHGKCGRLYLDQEEACQALQNQEVMDKIEGLIIDFSMSESKYCNAKIFERLRKLRLLKFVGVGGIRGSLNTSFQELRCISWHNCPLTRLPSSLRLQKLVWFDMPHSRFETLWTDFTMPSLRHLNLEGCKYLKELPESVGKLTKLDRMNVNSCLSLTRLPEPIVQLTTLGFLDMSGCENLKQLPEQLGDMKGLKKLDVSSIALEQLPDSIAHLKKLIHLKLVNCKKLKRLPEQFGNMEGLLEFHASYSGIEQLPNSFSNLSKLARLNLEECTDLTSLPNSIWKLKCLQMINLVNCKKLKRLPEQFGNMEGLETFDATFSAIEQLPDSFSNLRNLVDLKLHGCIYLTSLPNSLGQMQSLKELEASYTGIEELPDSIGQLPKIQRLDFGGCEKLNYVPDSIRNLTSLERLCLEHKDERMIELSDAVNNPNLKYLVVRCNIRVWLPVILSFSSLRTLDLHDDGPSLSPSKPFSFSKLFNLFSLKLTNCTSLGSSFPEVPLNLNSLEVHNHASLEQVPDLSNNLNLEHLAISRCSRLQSLQKLPNLLQSLRVCDCERLQDLPDLSMCRQLYDLVVMRNGRDLKVSLKETQLKRISGVSFKASLDNREIPEWFEHKNSSGCNLSFDIPMGDKFAGVAFWVVCNYIDVLPEGYPLFPDIEALITNKTEGGTKHISTFWGGEPFTGEGDVVLCVNGDEISVKSGDKIDVSFQFENAHPNSEARSLKMCGAHIIQKHCTCPSCPVCAYYYS